MVQLREFLHLIDRSEKVLPDKVYRQIGVRVWGKGAYERESIPGCNTKYKEFSKVCANDIIVNKIWARNGSIAIVTTELDGCYCSSEFPLFVVDERKACLGWVRWLIKTPWFWKQCMEKSGGTSGKNRITPDHFLEINVELPPLDMQTKAFHRLDNSAPSTSELELINKETIMLIQDLRQSILQEAVTGKLVPQDQMAESAEEQIRRIIEDRTTSYEKVVQNAKSEGRRIPRKPKNIQLWEKNKEIFFHEGKTPKTWANTYFINLCLLQRGFDLPKYQFKEGNFPVVSSGGVMGYHNEFKVKGPGVFTGRSGSVGKVYYIDSDYWPHNTTLFVMDFNGNNPKYVYYALRAYGIESESASTAVATLNRNRLFKMKILIPPFNEQVRIANKIDGLMKLCDELLDEVEENQENAQLLMEAILKETFAS